MKKDKKNNRINIYDSKTDEKKAYIATPYMYDSTQLNLCFDIEIKIEKTQENTWTVKYILSEDYLTADTTKYPVTVDPKIGWTDWDNVEIGATMRYLEHDANATNDDGFYIGPISINMDSQVNIRFPNLYETVKGKQITNAYFTMVPELVFGNPTINVYPIEEAWDYDTVTWNTRPAISDGYIASVTGSGYISKGNVSFFWIKKWIQQVAAGDISGDYGLAFEGAAGGYVRMYGQGTVSAPALVIEYTEPEQMSSTYDGSFEISAEHNSETNTIDITWDKYDDSITYYKICTRSDSRGYEVSGTTKELSYSLDASNLGTNVDVRVVAVNDEGSDSGYVEDDNYASNIVSFENSDYETDAETEQDSTEESSESEESIETAEEGENTDTQEETSETIYINTTFDTDGDGLEDGYEIWDLKTLWDTKDQSDEYVLDSDDDGFPDDYEVFYLGTSPTGKNVDGADSDGDGLTDLQEYKNGLEEAEEGKVGTDPWLYDSDFDNINDKGDTAPRKTASYTRQTVAAAAEVHKGLYDREYSETKDNITYTYITNIYKHIVKSIYIDYGEAKLNKKMKYFYDAHGNKTSVIEQYDESYDPYHTQTICITYTYNKMNNVTFICDQSTKYTMAYNDDGEMTSLKVGNQELINYDESEIINNSGEDEDTSDLNVGDVIRSDENITTYGNGQIVKTITTEYKVAENDTTSTASKVEIFYNTDENASYVTEYDSEENLLKFYDYADDIEEPIIYTYSYSDNATSVSRDDGFTKSVVMMDDEENSSTTVTTSYDYNDITGQEQTNTSTIVTNTKDENKTVSSVVFNNNNKYQYSIDTECGIIGGKIYSEVYNRYILDSTQTSKNVNNTSYNVDIYGDEHDKTYDYIYDEAGNITKVSTDGEVMYEYAYDAHGRLTTEKDNVRNMFYEYIYNETGNMQSAVSYPLDANGEKITSGERIKGFSYENNQWPDQLTSYGTDTITYDKGGNPINYIKGMYFTWSRGRQLSDIKFADDTHVIYKYNENGLRTYKETPDVITQYEWDNTRLIRETVTYRINNKKYDIWYLYDGMENMIGFEYTYITNLGEKMTESIYYEKNIQGDIIGIINSSGEEIASYSYDAWGNMTYSACTEENETAFNLNHITYRGYYRDEESGFYYLQSRYYDPEICRFINSDELNYFGIMKNAYSYNLYVYCECNPISYSDFQGHARTWILTTNYFKTESYRIMLSLALYFLTLKNKVITLGKEKEFISSWNSIANADVVAINSHGSWEGLYGDNSNQIVGSSTMKKLNKINCKVLILLGCNTGYQKKIWKNIAYKFSRKITGIVVASDGVATSSWINEIQPKFGSIITKDAPWGWVLYKSCKTYDIRYSTNIIEFTIPSILNYLKACKLVKF